MSFILPVPNYIFSNPSGSNPNPKSIYNITFTMVLWVKHPLFYTMYNLAD